MGGGKKLPKCNDSQQATEGQKLSAGSIKTHVSDAPHQISSECFKFITTSAIMKRTYLELVLNKERVVLYCILQSFSMIII